MNPIKVHDAWGEGWDKLVPPLSPLEGRKEEHAEAIVHELCHAFLLKLNPIFGRCKKILPFISSQLDKDGLPLFLRELHEIHALGAEYLVLEEIGINVDLYDLAHLGYRNFENENAKEDDITRLLLRATDTPSSKKAAADVVRFLKTPKYF